MSITNVAGKSITNTVSIHDTIFSRDTLVIVDKASQELMTNVQTFYSDNFSHLINTFWGFSAILFTLFGFVIPLVTGIRYYLNEKELKNKIDEYDKHITSLKNEIGNAKNGFTKSLNEQIQNADAISKNINEMKKELDTHKAKYDKDTKSIRGVVLKNQCTFYHVLGVKIATEITPSSNYISLSFLLKALLLSTFDTNEFDNVFDLIHRYSVPTGMYHKVINGENTENYSSVILDLDSIISDNNSYFSKKATELKELLIDDTTTKPQPT